YKNAQCNVTIPANGSYTSSGFANRYDYNIYGTIFFHANQSSLEGNGVSMNCLGRGACLQVGDLVNSNDYVSNAVKGISFRSPTNVSGNPSFAGVAITQTRRTSQVVTITTASAHGFRRGDMVTILFTDNNVYWGDAVVTTVPTSTTFTYAHSGSDIASQNTPGVVALACTAILDNGGQTHFYDIQYDLAGEKGHF